MNRLLILPLAVILMLSVLLLPVQISTAAEVKENNIRVTAVSTGWSHSLALMNDGTVWAWGDNSFSEIDRTGGKVSNPIPIRGLENVTSIAAGYGYSVVLKSDGTVWAWGSNYSGQVGDGTNEDTSTPVQVKGLSDIVAVSTSFAGSHTLALKKDGTVWAWGANYNGQLGDGTYEDRYTPVLVKNLNDVVAISAGRSYSAALKKDGTVWIWGDHLGMRFSDRTYEDQNLPVQVNDLTNVIALSAGEDEILALKEDRTVWGVGGSYGDTPVQIKGLSDIVDIAMGERHFLALKTDGTLWAGGDESSSLPGFKLIDMFTPVKVESLNNIKEISAAFYYYSLVLKEDGTVWEWGEVQSNPIRELKFTKEKKSSSHSKQDIISKWLKYRPSFNGEIYIDKPNVKAPYYAGKLHPDFINDGVNMANFVRFLAGLPDDLVADEQLNMQAQHGAVLLAAINQLTHYPSKPNDMDQAFYDKGYDSTTSSNLGMGYSSIHQSISSGYMRDEDASNIDRVGHRRWILNPPLKKIGFGYAGKFTAMQVFDKSRQDYFEYDYVAWPSNGFFPNQFFSGADPWSISLNPALYEEPNLSEVKVQLTRKSDQKKWIIDKSYNHYSPDGNYLNVDNACYGICNAIIFRPGNMENGYKDGDEFTVTITGIKDVEGNPAKIEYNVQFFDLYSLVGLHANQYNDYKENEYWSESMLWCIDKGLIKGYVNQAHPITGEYGNWLNPYGTLTEAQFLTILFRYMYPDELNTTKPTTDFWASVQYQLAEKYHLPTKGSLENNAPANQPITRGTMAQILATLHFKKIVSEKEAVQWMYDANLSKGYADKNGKYPKTYDSFGPENELKRAHIVTFIKRYDEYINR